jgi:Mitochondrial domain of unknown function (DUF1713)
MLSRWCGSVALRGWQSGARRTCSAYLHMSTAEAITQTACLPQTLRPPWEIPARRTIAPMWSAQLNIMERLSRESSQECAHADNLAVRDAQVHANTLQVMDRGSEDILDVMSLGEVGHRTGEVLEASSTLKKRRLKMNKHKYRKRRKRDRRRTKN